LKLQTIHAVALATLGRTAEAAAGAETMISHIKSLSLAAILAGVAGTISAAGAPLPQTGSTSFSGYFACRQLDAIDMGEAGSQNVAECVGITKNNSDPKLFDNMSVRCLEDGETRVGAYKYSGWCTQTDADGDKLFTSYTGQESGPVAYIGGTGKYKDISLQGTWTVHDAPALPTGQFAYVLDYKFDWRGK
jgi:hypothetical protein